MGAERVPIKSELYFRRVDICNWYAQELVRRFGYPQSNDYGTAYCIPQKVNPNEVIVYD
jgi:hypothetical protein